jgi:plastocyanin
MRRPIVVAAIVLLSASACANSKTPAGPTGPVAPAGLPGACVRHGGPDTIIEQRDFKFVPSCVIITTSQGFSIRNKGSVLHNFSVEGFKGLDIDIQPGQENNTETPGLKTGTYTFFCKYHRGRGMTGELRVTSG